MTHGLEMYVIYCRPSDYPDKWVVRRHFIAPGAMTAEPDIWAVGESLEEVRDMIPYGLYMVPRQEDDEPAITEVWF